MARNVFLIVLAALLLCLGIVFWQVQNTAPAPLEPEAPSELPTVTPVAADKSDFSRTVLERARSYQNIYEQASRKADFDASFSEADIQKMVDRVAAYGDPVIGVQRDMLNYKALEEFFQQALDGKECDASYYAINSRGNLTRTDFHALDGALYATVGIVGWDDAVNPTGGSTEEFVIQAWDYTEKGYFVYETNDELWPYEMQRVRPLGEDALALWNRYIRAIGYHGNNLFLTNWDQSDMGDVALNDLYEYLYLLDRGAPLALSANTESIPAQDFEPLFAKYLGLSPARLRDWALYDPEADAYFWNALTCRHHVLMPAPDSELVDYWLNEDGSQTLVVDAVDASRGADRLFTHEVTILPHDDGGFAYLSNRIRPEDEARVPDYRPRSQPYY